MRKHTPFVHHLARCAVWSTILVLSLPWPPLAALASAMVFFAAFSLFHDAAHGALELPGGANDVVLALTSIPLFMSAHGQRQLHLRHHARPLADDDLEGAGARVSLIMAGLTAPLASVHMRVEAVRAVNDRVRPWVIGENMVNLAVALAVVASGHLGLQVAFLVAVVLQHTMNAWASHVPHRAPRWLLDVASMFAWTKSPVVLALRFHLEHHAQPRLPCAHLKGVTDLASPLAELKLPWAQLQRLQRLG